LSSRKTIAFLFIQIILKINFYFFKEIYNTNLPKYKIYWKYALNFFNFKSNQNDNKDYNLSSDDDLSSLDEKKEEHDNSLNSATSQSILIETNTSETNQNNSNLIQFVDEERLENGSELAINSNSLANAAIVCIKNETKRSHSELRAKKPSLTPSEDDRDDGEIIKKESKLATRSLKTSIIAYQTVKQMMKNVYETYPELVMPGNILYIYRIKSENVHVPVINRFCSNLFSCYKVCKYPKYEIHYDSRWATQEEFKKIVITSRMLMDHFPNTVTDALSYFSLTDRIVV
jgi:hypothetical protein